jgi:hypothetical protein
VAASTSYNPEGIHDVTGKGGGIDAADTSPTLTNCCGLMHWLLVGTQRIMNCTQRMLMRDSPSLYEFKLPLGVVAIVRLVRSCVLGADVTGACDVSVARPSPCARMPHRNTFTFTSIKGRRKSIEKSTVHFTQALLHNLNSDQYASTL